MLEAIQSFFNIILALFMLGAPASCFLPLQCAAVLVVLYILINRKKSSD